MESAAEAREPARNISPIHQSSPPALPGTDRDVERSIGVVREALGSRDYETRLFAVEALGSVPLADAVGWLANALGDPEHDVRVAAIEALRRHGSARARQLLCSVRDDRSEALDIRALAASALLGRQGD
jgi:HEAT repeat protein